MVHTEDEIIKILKFIEESSFDELQLITDDLQLIVRKNGGIAKGTDGDHVSLLSPGEISADQPSADSPPRQEESESENGRAGYQENEQDGLLPIRAPMLGMCYMQPEPGAPPYVGIGTVVGEDTTVCLIEIMKVFNAVKAGTSGSIRKICVKNGELVEYGQTLFLVEKDEKNG